MVENGQSKCQSRRWAIILAGGEGSRLRALTRRITGREVPKQFCPVVGDTTLLEQTRQRIALSIGPERSVVVVNRAHESYYAPLLADVPIRQVVVQPENRGTAPAILYALLRLTQIDPAASVALFPSDHYVSKPDEFMRQVEAAFDAIRVRPELTVLLGAAPRGAESGYGWIEPGRPLMQAPLYRVRRFFEKPSLELTHELWQRGCLLNTFVMVARLKTLLDQMMLAMPGLCEEFGAVRAGLASEAEERSVRALYRELPTTNFSDGVLARNPAKLAVLPVRNVAWSDLGEPHRVMNLLSRLGSRPKWVAA